MKIQLYAVPGFSGAVSTLRKIDGRWDAIDQSTISGAIDYIHADGHPVDQAGAEARVKYPILTSRAIARFYGIPEEVELYGCEE